MGRTSQQPPGNSRQAGITSRPPGLENFGLPGPNPLRETNKQYLARCDREESIQLTGRDREPGRLTTIQEKPSPKQRPSILPYIQPQSTPPPTKPDSDLVENSLPSQRRLRAFEPRRTTGCNGIIGPSPDPSHNLSTIVHTSNHPPPIDVFLGKQQGSPSDTRRYSSQQHNQSKLPPIGAHLGKETTRDPSSTSALSFNQQFELIDLLEKNRNPRRNSFAEAPTRNRNPKVLCPVGIQEDVGPSLPARSSALQVRNSSERDCEGAFIEREHPRQASSSQWQNTSTPTTLRSPPPPTSARHRRALSADSKKSRWEGLRNRLAQHAVNCSDIDTIENRVHEARFRRGSDIPPRTSTPTQRDYTGTPCVTTPYDKSVNPNASTPNTASLQQIIRDKPQALCIGPGVPSLSTRRTLARPPRAFYDPILFEQDIPNCADEHEAPSLEATKSA